jgi:starch synthase
MACGVPVVATRVGGVPEIAAEGGVLLVEADSAVDLADALQKLIRDKDLRIEMGAEGLTSFQQRFAWDVIVKQYWELIDNI